MRKIIRDFLQLESASGMVLLATALIALIWANSPFSSLYEQFTKRWLFLINEGLMAVFFLLVGLELKRGFREGHFAKASDVLLPLAAACGGMIVPAVIYLLMNYTDPVKLQGFATPVATDIAFAIGVVSLFGRAISRQLTLFLLSIAIFDDLGAILLIALFYSHSSDPLYLGAAFILMLVMLIMNLCRVRYMELFLIAGMILWYFFLKSGIHPTVAGIVTAFTLPNVKWHGKRSLESFEHKLRPYVVFGIMPLFALANAGLPFAEVHSSMLFDSVTLGIIAGLLLGKQIGVMSVTWLTVRLSRVAKLPLHTTWLEFYGIALVCGIGFTMSLFLGTLSFENHPQYINEVRLGVLLGSLFSGLIGASVLTLAINRKGQRTS